MTDSSSPSRTTSPVKVEDSPVTTPEPPSIPAQPASKLSAEALEVVSNWKNFIPLGSIHVEDNSVAGQARGTWKDVAVLPHTTNILSNFSKLLANGWIRVQSTCCLFEGRQLLSFRIYILQSDVGQSCIDRSRRQLRNALEAILPEIDVSAEAWAGRYTSETANRFDPWAARDEDNPSLFYAFNKIPSPSPDASEVKERYSNEVLKDLLDGCAIGLRTNLYPYQRRSAGEMLRRELVSRPTIDPRFEIRVAPDGVRYYFNPRDVKFVRKPAEYEACRGGLLAETMGNGKTVMCLALILATKNIPPRIPVNYVAPKVRPKVGSLADMCVSAINQNSCPWKIELDRIQHATGTTMSSLSDRLEKSPGAYDVPVIPYRFNRNTRSAPPHHMTLASTTIIVVPPNLCKQWQSEISKHVEKGALKVLVMDNRKKSLPSPNELRSYDIILFTRNRFDMESKHGEDAEGRRVQKAPLSCRCPYIGSSRKRDCTCIREESIYDSPLRYLHFKRLIIDEGHFFSSSRTNTAHVAKRLVTADHRWIVSGTPAQDLLGAEVQMSAKSEFDADETIDDLLEQQRFFSARDKTGAIDSLGSMVANFLEIEPWSSCGTWRDFVFCHKDRRHTFSGFSACLQKILQSIVVKTRPEDVERDIELPPLHHTIVRLEPSFYDKLTANLFTLVLTSNAITSEREDSDYLFHKNSAQARTRLITNLRQSAFFWTGFSELDVEATRKVGEGYLSKEGTKCSPEDRALLNEALSCTDVILNSLGWLAMSRSQELGVFVEEWPAEVAEHWTFNGDVQTPMTGLTQLTLAQRYVNGRLGEDDPAEGLSGTGIKALAPARSVPKKNQKEDLENSVVDKSGVPSSSIEPFDSRNPSPRSRKSVSKTFPVVKSASNIAPLQLKSPGKSPPDAKLDCDSPYLQAKIVGTTSAKLSYLISQVLKFQEKEKILVFYQGDHIAFYISQLLDCLHIKHEIYAKSLDGRLKAEYIVNFNQGSAIRVLLMDVRQAAYGLNCSSASRIFFVNPVCRPNDEAQAIKRAHRIGQTRPVFVETLVLKGSMEEKMLERSKRMTKDEHRDARTLEDDYEIREIIQSARMLPIGEKEQSTRGQMAPIEHFEPLYIWDRPGWRDYVAHYDTRKQNRKRKRTVSMNDVTNPDDPGRIIEEEEDIGPSPSKRPTLSLATCS